MNRKVMLMLTILAVLVLGCGSFPRINRSEAVNRASTTITVGSQAVISDDGEWVKVVNKEPIAKHSVIGVREFIAGEECGVNRGGLITVLEIRKEDLLVEYSASEGSEEYQYNIPNSCPSGVQFILSKSDFVTMNDQYGAIQEEIELIERVLVQNYYGLPKDAGDWHWVEVVNPVPVIQNFSNMDDNLTYGGRCGCGRNLDADFNLGGFLRARGEVDGMVLYEYTAYGNRMGTPCPSGVLLFQSK